MNKQVFFFFFYLSFIPLVYVQTGKRERERERRWTRNIVDVLVQKSSHEKMNCIDFDIFIHERVFRKLRKDSAWFLVQICDISFRKWKDSASFPCSVWEQAELNQELRAMSLKKACRLHVSMLEKKRIGDNRRLSEAVITLKVSYPTV